MWPKHVSHLLDLNLVFFGLDFLRYQRLALLVPRAIHRRADFGLVEVDTVCHPVWWIPGSCIN